jgi:hypothetical protein
MSSQRTARLLFSALTDGARVRGDLSAVCASDENLWLACDEGTCLERLTRTAPDTYKGHRRFDLAALLDLPVPDGEVDIEGLDVDGGYLWLVGSHSLKRNKPKDGASAADNIKRMAKIESDGNRYLLARIPLAKDSLGDFVLRRKHGALTAAQVAGDERSNELLEALRADPYLAPFAPQEVGSGGKRKISGMPSKENGLDIEGLAVSGSRVFVGLRGPVIRGWAIVLELEIRAGKKRLKLNKIGPDGQRYRKHFLNLDGLGVRELATDGHDLLILAGPTLDLDGPVAVYRWENALNAGDETVIPRENLVKVLRVPHGLEEHRGRDHAEGILRLSPPGAPTAQVLIVYDSPAHGRLDGDFGVRADVFDLAPAEVDPPRSAT